MNQEAKYISIIMFTLVAIGVIMTYSASAVYADQVFNNSTYFLKRQLLYVLLGFIGFYLGSRLDPMFLKRHSRAILGIAILMLVLVFFPVIGHSAGGARRWIRIPLFTFQPVEFTKLAMCIYLADYLSRKMKLIMEGGISVFVPPLIVMGTVVLLIIIQPDLGSCIFLFLLIGILFFLSGIRLRYIFVSAVIALTGITYLILREPYRLRRITAYLDPWKDAQGSGFQIIQSYLAFALGGLGGVGLGGSTQKLFYLPQSYTDFIFSIIAEELGFLGSVVVLSLYAAFFILGIRIANKCRDPFKKLLAQALVLLIVLQALINLLVVVGLIPTKGLPLPFISYGGSALLFHMTAVGVLVAIGRSARTHGGH